jgi:hypothetical protein
MDARLLRLAIVVAACGSLGASYRTNNFIVTAPSAEMAQQIGKAAEAYRRDLARDWLGQEMPNWAQPCPITAQVADHLGAGGATSFYFEHGEVYGWRMTIQGSLVRILDSVLPHEVTHTVFATHFRQPLPRWADEGACTTVEHTSEKQKQQVMLIDFLRTGRGIAFSQMFMMKEYPHDVMPLYSQGYSVARYLVAQGGKRKFLDFLADGLKDENWTRALRSHYGVNSLATLQTQWLDWVRKGSPALDSAPQTPALVAVPTRPRGEQPAPDVALASADTRSAPRAAKGPRPSDMNDDVNTGDAGKTVYELAGTAGNVLPPNAAGADGWHAPAVPGTQRGASAATTDLAMADMPAATTDKMPADPQVVTRPQPMERARQVILEWGRPNAADPTVEARQSGYQTAAPE